MPNLNLKYTKEEYKKLLKKKLAESKRRKKNLRWEQFILIAISKIKK